jgi:hypothetical protein
MKEMEKMKGKKELYICLLILGGIVFLCASGYLLLNNVDLYTQIIYFHYTDIVTPLLCIIIGVGLIIFSVTRLTMIRMVLKHPEAIRSIEIDARDERQKHINHMARSRAFTAMEIVYAALTVTFIALRERPLILLLLIGGYAIGWLIYFIYLRKLAKEM